MAGRVGFVGLGVMGEPMAGHLFDAGADLMVWNRTASKADDLVARGAQRAGSLRELGSVCSAVFLCVARTEDVRECLAELSADAQPGTLFVDHSTIAPAAAVSIHAELSGRGFRFVDAPLTGGSMGAMRGQLTMFCGGTVSDVEDAISAMKPYTKRAERVGGPGAGQRMKMANQIAVSGTLLALCECLSFSKKADLNVQQAWEMIGGGAGGSWSFENYGPKILASDWSPGFSVNNQRKDLGYCREEAAQIDAAIPGAMLVDRLLAKLEEAGRSSDMTGALYEVMMEMHSE